MCPSLVFRARIARETFRFHRFVRRVFRFFPPRNYPLRVRRCTRQTFTGHLRGGQNAISTLKAPPHETSRTFPFVSISLHQYDYFKSHRLRSYAPCFFVKKKKTYIFYLFFFFTYTCKVFRKKIQSIIVHMHDNSQLKVSSYKCSAQFKTLTRDDKWTF